MPRPSQVAAYHRRVVAWLLGRSRWRRRRPVAALAGGALTWVWPWANPPFWAIYQTHDGGATFVLEETGWDGALREYAPADGNLPAYVVGVDAVDREVTGRSNVATPVAALVNLLAGLEEFYVGTPGRTNLRSLTEPAGDAGDLWAGRAGASATEQAGAYGAGTAWNFELVPYTVRAEATVLAGLPQARGGGRRDRLRSGVGRVERPARVVRGHPGDPLERELQRVVYRDVPAANWLAGWTDTAEDWTSGPGTRGLPWTLTEPPTVARYVWGTWAAWNVVDALVTLASPLGGWAVDCDLGPALVRVSGEPALRAGDRTLAFWFRPTGETSYADIAGVRGVWTRKLVVNCALQAGSLRFWSHLDETWDVAVSGHQGGDWYLVVMRLEEALDALRLDVHRLRDGAAFSGAGPWVSETLDGTVDYVSDGHLGVVSFGCPGHWVAESYGAFDRMGLWHRALSDVEVEALFNEGLGWSPG
jgi:hypothetical protein